DNAASCQFILTVKDTQAPSVRCPEDVSVEAQEARGAAVTFHWDAPMDTVTQEPSLTPSVASGSTFPLGTTSVTLTARDDAGNTASCAFSVTVRDTAPPTLVCPAAVEVSTPDASGHSVTYPAAQAHDAVTGAPQVSYSHGSGSRFPLGTTSVRVTAKDEAGLSSECTFPVTVNQVSEPAPVPSRPGSHGCAAGPGSSGGLTWLLVMLSTAWWWRRSRGGVSTR
ncbi:HYR domain-containing protein, partial [Myxococcus fulvus]|uniref:HYR domain-containing protein n=1 Tax=Myxococcus fulvus TaxID=33 RepID=UPI003B9D2A49